jgi:transcriptional regulator with XRE-family HTH domain
MSRKILPKNVKMFEIGQRIKQLRELKGLSQNSLAEKLGLKNRSASISEWEGGIKEAGITLLCKLSVLFKEVNLHWLLTGEGSPTIVNGKSQPSDLDPHKDPKLFDIVRILQNDEEAQCVVYDFLEAKKHFDRASSVMRRFMMKEAGIWFSAVSGAGNDEPIIKKGPEE